MRVLIVNPGMRVYGGAELVIIKIANYLTKNGIKNALLTTSILPEIQRELMDTDVIIKEKSKLNSLTKKFIFLDILDEIVALYKGLRNNVKNFDVINIHNFPAELTILSYHKPIVWMCNEPPEICIAFNSEKNLLRKCIKKIILIFDKFLVRRYMKNVVVADEYNAKRFKRIYGFNPEIINYGIDYEFFSKRNKEEALNTFNFDNNFIVLQVGMLTPYKNQMESIKTIEKLKNRIPNIRLILAGWGEGNYRVMLEEYIKEKNLGQNVIITGHLSRERVRDLYHVCDVLLHPVKSQGGWLVPFEALCAKKPIVVSPEMTASDIIKKEKIGIVTREYAGAILDIHRTPEKYSGMMKKGEIWVRNNLTWNKFCEEMLNLLMRGIK